MLGLVGSVAVTKGIIPNLVEQAQQGLIEPNQRSLLEARQSGSESIIPAIARHSGLPLILGLVLASAMMAIIVSTADSFLLIPATNLTRDVYLKYINFSLNEKQILLISRIIVLFLGIIAFLLVSKFKTILNAAYTAYNIYGTALTPSLLAAFLWKRATKEGAVSSILTGTIITIVWTFALPQWPGFYTLHPFFKELTFPAAFSSIIVLFLVSILTPKPPKESLKPFFNS